MEKVKKYNYFINFCFPKNVIKKYLLKNIYYFQKLQQTRFIINILKNQTKNLRFYFPEEEIVKQGSKLNKVQTTHEPFK